MYDSKPTSVDVNAEEAVSPPAVGHLDTLLKGDGRVRLAAHANFYSRVLPKQGVKMEKAENPCRTRALGSRVARRDHTSILKTAVHLMLLSFI